MYKRLASAIVVTFLASAAMSSTWSVQRDGTGDFATIQPALDAAADGDTILIGPGEYTEATTVRLPGWAYDIESYAHLRCDNLTIIGAGMDATVIGPATYRGNAATGSPAGLSYSVGGGTLHISDLGIRHSYAMFVRGILYMDRCHLSNNDSGLSWSPSGPGGWVRDSVFEVTEPIFDSMSFEIGYGGLSDSIVLEHCYFGAPASIRSVSGFMISDSDLSGLNIYSGSTVTIVGCRPNGPSAGITLGTGSGITCTIRDTTLRDETAPLAIAGSSVGGRFIVDNCVFEGGSDSVMYFGRYAGPCEIHHSDFVVGSGAVVRCETAGPAVTHDLRSNFWGTTEEATIRSRIIGASSSPSSGATVLYTPFAGQSVPAEGTSWGDLKALWR